MPTPAKPTPAKPGPRDPAVADAQTGAEDRTTLEVRAHRKPAETYPEATARLPIGRAQERASGLPSGSWDGAFAQHAHQPPPHRPHRVGPPEDVYAAELRTARASQERIVADIKAIHLANVTPVNPEAAFRSAPKKPTT